MHFPSNHTQVFSEKAREGAMRPGGPFDFQTCAHTCLLNLAMSQKIFCLICENHLLTPNAYPHLMKNSKGSGEMMVRSLLQIGKTHEGCSGKRPCIRRKPCKSRACSVFLDQDENCIAPPQLSVRLSSTSAWICPTRLRSVN